MVIYFVWTDKLQQLSPVKGKMNPIVNKGDQVDVYELQLDTKDSTSLHIQPVVPFKTIYEGKIPIEDDYPNIIQALKNRESWKLDDKKANILVSYEKEKNKEVKQIPILKKEVSFSHYVDELIDSKLKKKFQIFRQQLDGKNGEKENGKEGVKTFSQKKEQNLLEVIYNWKEERMKVKLKIMHEKGFYELYDIDFDQTNIPKQVEKHLQRMENIFNCFKEKNYQILPFGNIKLETSKWSSKLILERRGKKDFYMMEEEIEKMNSYQMQNHLKLQKLSTMVQSKIQSASLSSIIEESISNENRKIELVEQKTKQLLHQMKSQLQKKLCQSSQQAQSQLKNLGVTMRENANKQTQLLSEKFKKQIEAVVQRMGKEIESLNLKIEDKMSEYINCSKQFQINKRTITFKGNKISHLFINKIIPSQNLFTFSCKILKTNNANIKIGVVKYKHQLTQRSSYLSGNAVCYIGWNGMITYGSYADKKYKVEGKGFGQREEVEMMVDIKKKKVIWKVQNSERANITVDMLGDGEDLVPFIEFYESGDSVEWNI